MKIALVSCHSAQYQELARITWLENKAKFCHMHGFYGVNVLMSVSPKMNFEKFRLMKALFADGYDWVFATGTDSMITNMCAKSLFHIIDTAASALIAVDRNGINADNIIVHNDGFGSFLVRDMLDLEKECNNEQEALNRITQTSDYASEYVLTPQRAFNSYNYDLYPSPAQRLDILSTNGHWQPGDFMIHWPGFADNPERRVVWANEMLGRVQYE